MTPQEWAIKANVEVMTAIALSSERHLLDGPPETLENIVERTIREAAAPFVALLEARSAALAGCTEGSEEEAELKRIAEVLEGWH